MTRADYENTVFEEFELYNFTFKKYIYIYSVVYKLVLKQYYNNSLHFFNNGFFRYFNCKDYFNYTYYPSSRNFESGGTCRRF